MGETRVSDETLQELTTHWQEGAERGKKALAAPSAHGLKKGFELDQLVRGISVNEDTVSALRELADLRSTIRTDNSRVINELQRLADQRNATIGRMGQEIEALKQAATDFLNASQALDDNYNDTQGAVAPKEMGDVYSNAKDRLKRALGFYAMPKGGE